jgi:DNA-binding response OmpR family regulator
MDGGMRQRIVIVDDDQLSTKVMRYVLDEEGYETVAVSRGSQAFVEIVGRETDLVILDVSLPDLDGFTLCKELRARRYHGPVIFLTGRTGISDKLEGFRIGADDYIVKPYDPLELVARVRGVIRRFQLSTQNSLATVIRVEDAELALGNLTYSSNDVEPALLSPTEMQILEVLMRNARLVISRDTLVERVWGYYGERDTNRLDVYIRRIRRKIERDPSKPRYLHTVRGSGYVFQVAPLAGAAAVGDVLADQSATP